MHASDQSLISEVESSRNKRQAGVGPPDPYGFSAAKTRCPLLLMADFRFFREIGGGSTKTTINYLVCYDNKSQFMTESSNHFPLLCSDV